MITNIKFGECLNFLISTLDISINRLSKAINIDSSLANRWIHGKRIPSYNTPYIESISEYLSKNVLNTFQIQHINKLYLSVFEENEPIDSIKEKIKKVLLESQGYSIECESKKRREMKNRSTNNEQNSKFIKINQLYFDRQNNINDENLILDINNPVHSVNLSCEDKIVFGTENVLAASISLLEVAANQNHKNSNMIYITYNNDIDIEDHIYDSLVLWRSALLKAIHNGWNVVFIVRLNNNTNRTIKFINFTKPLIKTGRFFPYYIKKYDSLSMGKEIIAVSGIGVLSCFSTNLPSFINCAFYFKTKTAVSIFGDYFNMLLPTHTQPLVKYYSHENNTDYNRCLVENEENIGNRFLYKYCFSVSTLPEKLYKKLLKKKNLSNDEMFATLETYERRVNAFLSNIQNYEYKDIYLADSINDLIKSQQLCFYSYAGVETVDLEIQDIIEYLENIVHLLSTYNNYNIAFIPQNTDKTLIGDNFYCLVKERQTVLLEAFEFSKSMPETRLSINEPLLVKAFDEYFKEIWERIPPVNNDKKEVIKWMQSLIKILKK